MTTSLKISKLTYFAAACAVAVLVAGNAGTTWAGNNGETNSPPLHGPGSSHNPIVYHPVHGPGSSHNPIVSKSGGNALPNGTVVRDHRNGKNCSYVVGNCGSIRAYRACEGLPYQGIRC